MTLTKQGEILLILVKRDGRSAEEIADLLGIDKSYLPKLYKMDRLPRKPLHKVIDVFPGMEPYFTETGRTYSGVSEPQSPYRTSETGPRQEEIAQLIRENAAIRAELDRLNQDFEQQKLISANLAEAIANLTKR